MSSILTSQTTDMVRRNIITPDAVWEERSTREDSWLHSGEREEEVGNLKISAVYMA